jgi:uncharacterized protein (DUF488 family)
MSSEFANGLAEPPVMAAERRTGMMCSEALWWRCHRRLVADRLVVAGDCVWHIGAGRRVTEHQLTPVATVEPDGLITYSSTPGQSQAATSFESPRTLAGALFWR